MVDFFKQVYAVAWGDIRFLRHTWKNVLASCTVLPVLYLIAFGFGLRSGTTGIDGISYRAFVIPGIVALSSLSSAFSATSTRMNVQRLYYKCFDEMMMCPLSYSAIVVGKSMQGLLKGMISCCIMYTLGLILEPGVIVLSPIFIALVLLSCFTFSLLGMTAALLARSHASIGLFNSLVITPMTFLCGTFFSTSALGPAVEAVLYCIPLTHSSMLLRAAALPDHLEFPVFSLVLLIAFCAVFFSINYYLLSKKKV